VIKRPGQSGRPVRYGYNGELISASPSRPIKQVCRNRSGPISPCPNGAKWMPSTRRASSRARLVLRSDRELAKIVAVADQHVEGVELDLGVVLAGTTAI